MKEAQARAGAKRPTVVTVGCWDKETELDLAVCMKLGKEDEIGGSVQEGLEAGETGQCRSPGVEAGTKVMRVRAQRNHLGTSVCSRYGC